MSSSLSLHALDSAALDAACYQRGSWVFTGFGGREIAEAQTLKMFLSRDLPTTR
jgi:hypothetical protein